LGILETEETSKQKQSQLSLRQQASMELYLNRSETSDTGKNIYKSKWDVYKKKRNTMIRKKALNEHVHQDKIEE